MKRPVLVLTLTALVALAACVSHQPVKPPEALGQPMPTASTSAEPGWIHN